MGEITRLLNDAADEREGALGEVFDRLYDELKVIARSRLRGPRGTLTTTALIGDLYVKLIGAEKLSFANRKHFFATAAAAMRHIVVDHARAAGSQKRGGDQIMITLDDQSGEGTDPEILALDEALDELEQVDGRLRQLVELRYFAGLTMAELSELLERSVSTLNRDWARARAFLHARMSG